MRISRDLNHLIGGREGGARGEGWWMAGLRGQGRGFAQLGELVWNTAYRLLGLVVPLMFVWSSHNIQQVLFTHLTEICKNFLYKEG